MSDAKSAIEPATKIADHRGDLQDLAASGLPCAELAETLLEIADGET